MYHYIKALFIAQLYEIHLPLIIQISLMVVLMVTSKDIARVSGESFVDFLATLGVGIPKKNESS